ncbi:hypothetical protein D9M71_614800 [compost metagenome]
MNRLRADRTAIKQMLRRRPRIVEGENTEAVEHHRAHPLGKHRRPALRCMGMPVQQTMADGLGADEIVLDVTAPQIIWALDAQLLRGSGAHQCLGRQQIDVPPAMHLRVVAATELEPEDLRQPTGQGAIGFDFVLRRIGAHRMGDYQFLAVGWGHASPFSCR